jgi:hypothetical protein
VHAQRDDRPFRLSAPVFACPACGRTAHNPEDARQGYCGACHDFTGRGDVYECGQCGTRFIVPPSHAGAVWCSCGAPEPMHASRESGPGHLTRGLWQFAASGPVPPSRPDAAAAARYIAEEAERMADVRHPVVLSSGDTLSFTVSRGLISSDPPPESAGSQDEADVYPYDSSMRWSPGDTEW